jgi:hypothetical protein
MDLGITRRPVRVWLSVLRGGGCELAAGACCQAGCWRVLPPLTLTSRHTYSVCSTSCTSSSRHCWSPPGAAIAGDGAQLLAAVLGAACACAGTHSRSAAQLLLLMLLLLLLLLMLCCRHTRAGTVASAGGR